MDSIDAVEEVSCFLCIERRCADSGRSADTPLSFTHTQTPSTRPDILKLFVIILRFVSVSLLSFCRSVGLLSIGVDSQLWGTRACAPALDFQRFIFFSFHIGTTQNLSLIHI